MQDLNIKETRLTPSIIALVDKATIEIKGVSTPEHVVLFYTPINEWIIEFFKTADRLKFTFKIHYMNTTSTYVIKELIKTADKYGEITVDWYFELDGEDMKETGEMVSEVANVDFDIIGRDRLFY